ncbi:hypothetical protein NPIL_375541 [Nephila pilipes]|uniref:Uncharacterized protein n=1 Tax=Nephila pilipes TaxID=299642 RepID=A0A8X6T7W3_NEPPI|nr:hypothetical protein NPIL_375541 [Nephila pilipes]
MQGKTESPSGQAIDGPSSCIWMRQQRHTLSFYPLTRKQWRERDFVTSAGEDSDGGGCVLKVGCVSVVTAELCGHVTPKRGVGEGDPQTRP